MALGSSGRGLVGSVRKRVKRVSGSVGPKKLKKRSQGTVQPKVRKPRKRVIG